MPKTRGELNKYINKILSDLLEEAKGTGEHYADITVAIKGDGEFIHCYIKDMCDKYNDKNDIWKCCVDEDTDDVCECTLITLKVCHTDDSGDRFGWVQDYDDTPLDGSNTDSDDNDEDA